MATITITDGTRLVGTIVEKLNEFEAYDADNRYIAKLDSVPAARGALLKRDRERREKGAA